jgi:hypothetical protein
MTTAMIFDDLLFAIILAGLGLSGAYLRAELLSHRRMTKLQRTRELVQLELHAKRAGLEQNNVSRRPRILPSPARADAPYTMRVLARALRICLQERKFKLVRERARTGDGYGL